MEKKRIAVLFGGRSSEHDVSLTSAAAVMAHMDKEKYEPVPIGITKEGNWYFYKGAPENIEGERWFTLENCVPAVLSCNPKDSGFLIFPEGKTERLPVDGVFPVLHGKWGEDGTVQGLIALSGLPVIGCGVLASVLCMDKHRSHILAKEAGIAVPKGVVLKTYMDREEWRKRIRTLSLPLYVKPVREGSSFGISRVEHYDACIPAIEKAFLLDEEVIVEEEVAGFEVGCAVMGKNFLFTGEVDEIELSHGFFDFTEKYQLITSQIHMPARISSEMTYKVKETAKRLYRILGLSGFARVDLFCTPEGGLVFNEVNTIPGFTSHSRFPNMMKGAGLSFGDMLDHIIQEALYEKQEA